MNNSKIVVALVIGILIGVAGTLFLRTSSTNHEAQMNTANVIRSAYEQLRLLELLNGGVGLRCKVVELVEFNQSGIEQIDHRFLGGEAQAHALSVIAETKEAYDQERVQQAIDGCTR